ncbi:hypothetical protein [Pedococcus sp. P5_B7]
MPLPLHDLAHLVLAQLPPSGFRGAQPHRSTSDRTFSQGSRRLDGHGFGIRDGGQRRAHDGDRVGIARAHRGQEGGLQQAAQVGAHPPILPPGLTAPRR